MVFLSVEEMRKPISLPESIIKVTSIDLESLNVTTSCSSSRPPRLRKPLSRVSDLRFFPLVKTGEFID